MTSKDHRKHAFLKKPSGGKFHRNELAFLGAPCGYIKGLVSDVEQELRGHYRLGYADADHGKGESQPDFYVTYTDKITHHEVGFSDPDIEYSWPGYFHQVDAMLVNGNHFTAENQVVLIHPGKKESLERKLDRLTNVRMIILTEEVDEPWDFLKSALGDQLKNIPVIQRNDLSLIAKIIREWIVENRPVVKGLVLAGGKSVRMGTDKGQIDYHGKPQREYAAELLGHVCDEVLISSRPGMEIETDYEVLYDSFTDLGPYGAILSAFRHDPDAAWLCIACDIPLLDKAALERLVRERDHSKVATCYHNPETEFPEPLITIWEPRAYPRLLHFLSRGYSCPRKVLINSDVFELDVDRTEILTNVNTPEEMEQLKRKYHA